MNALVTGGAGFIGSRLIARLLEQGHAVRVLDDLSTGSTERLPPSTELVLGSVTDPTAVQRAVTDVEVVFHLAARIAVVESFADPVRTFETNVCGTAAVLDAARREGVRRVVFASSSAVYGETGDSPIREDHALRPSSPYGASKLSGEILCRLYAKHLGLETVALRYFNVYGPGQSSTSSYAAVIPAFIDALTRGRQPLVHADGRQVRDFVFVEDVVEANLAAATAPKRHVSGEVFNIGSGTGTRILDLVAIMADALGTPANAELEPGSYGGVRASIADTTRARSHLGFRSDTTLPAGIRLVMDATQPRQHSARTFPRRATAPTATSLSRDMPVDTRSLGLP